MKGAIHQVNVSGGGVPKRPVGEGRVTALGLEGDRQAKPGIHGGPYRALSLLALEVIEALAAEGHPIAPGSVGENLTVRGLDWVRVVPGTALRLGDEVRIRITSYAAPCRTIAGSFSDGNMNRLNRVRAPGRSRLYAEVLREGVVRPGDAVEVEPDAERATAPIDGAEAVRAIAQVAIPSSDLERSVAFYRDALGATYTHTADPPGLAFLRVGDVALMLDGPAHGGGAARPNPSVIYFAVEDIDASYRAIRARGVEFDAPPLLQYATGDVEGWMAFFSDPDGNPLALLEVRRLR